MDAEEYTAQQQGIVAALVRTVLSLFRPLRGPGITPVEWVHLLEVIYPSVERARAESAALGRRFYDAQRQQHHPDLPRHDSLLAGYQFDWFREAMEPARRSMSQPGADDGAVSQVALRAAKEIENAGRRTILRAVKTDPVVKGWARVATGRETCGFCMMLVSRGPVYTSADNAGLDLNDTSAADLWKKADAGDVESQQVIDELMTRWHPGCDCKVVPVFKLSDWPGRDAWKRAEDAWIEYTKGHSGLDALNAFRRAVEDGALDPRDFAVAA